MTIVLVHGAPNTASMWDRLRHHLADLETVALRLPGFGEPLPAGFDATRWGYRDWVIEQIAKIGHPVDLVGHDQGAIISQGVLLERPDLVRTIVLSGAIADDEYLWHALARVWQTPGLGEQSMDLVGSLSKPDLAAALADASRLAPEDALPMANELDATMREAMLTLYRSEPSMADWTLNPDRTYPPALVLWGEHDHAQDGPRFGGQAASAMGGTYREVADTGHYWMFDQAGVGADILRSFWSHPVTD